MLSAQEIREILRLRIENGESEDQIASDTGLAKGTIRKFLRSKIEDSFRDSTIRRATSKLRPDQQKEDENVYRYISKNLRCSQDETILMRKNISPNYLLFRRSSPRNSLIISHVNVDTSNENLVRFTENIKLDAPTFSPVKESKFRHEGFVFYRTGVLYLWNVAGSNLRTLALKLWGQEGFSKAAGVTVGRSAFHGLISQKIVLLETELSNEDVKDLIGGNIEPMKSEYSEIFDQLGNMENGHSLFE